KLVMRGVVIADGRIGLAISVILLIGFVAAQQVGLRLGGGIRKHAAGLREVSNCDGFEAKDLMVYGEAEVPDGSNVVFIVSSHGREFLVE
ncbi:hypothetical protein BGX26_000811, partial [Mortierella sp. AD094]